MGQNPLSLRGALEKLACSGSDVSEHLRADVSTSVGATSCGSTHGLHLRRDGFDNRRVFGPTGRGLIEIDGRLIYGWIHCCEPSSRVSFFQIGTDVFS